MLGTKHLILILISVFIAPASHAYEESWGIFQFRKKLEHQNQIFFEVIRRDYGDLFEARYFGLYRLSWGGQLGSWTYLVGGSYVDFESVADERRLHQFFIYPLKNLSSLTGVLRLGLEERSFIGDNQTYLRERIRLQFSLLPQYNVNPAFYHEAFFVPNGFRKFKSGMNEARSGFGLHYSLSNFEMYLYYVYAEFKTRKATDKSHWIQVQTVLNF